MKSKRILIAMLLCTILSACGGGGGSSSSGMLIEGTLTEAGGAGHANVLLRHGVGQRIENVTICALGECSTTDAEGQWGFVASESFVGGAVLFSIVGHGIETTSVVEIPSDAHDVFLDFQHVEGGGVEAHDIVVDGESTHQGEEH